MSAAVRRNDPSESDETHDQSLARLNGELLDDRVERVAAQQDEFGSWQIRRPTCTGYPFQLSGHGRQAECAHCESRANARPNARYAGACECDPVIDSCGLEPGDGTASPTARLIKQGDRQRSPGDVESGCLKPDGWIGGDLVPLSVDLVRECESQVQPARADTGLQYAGSRAMDLDSKSGALPREAGQRAWNDALGVFFRHAYAYLAGLVDLTHAECCACRLDGSMCVWAKP